MLNWYLTAKLELGATVNLWQRYITINSPSVRNSWLWPKLSKPFAIKFSEMTTIISYWCWCRSICMPGRVCLSYAILHRLRLLQMVIIYWKQHLFIRKLCIWYKMYRFQDKFTIFDFIIYTSLHMIENPFCNIFLQTA